MFNNYDQKLTFFSFLNNIKCWAWTWLFSSITYIRYYAIIILFLAVRAWYLDQTLVFHFFSHYFVVFFRVETFSTLRRIRLIEKCASTNLFSDEFAVVCQIFWQRYIFHLFCFHLSSFGHFLCWNLDEN